jgi:hypothetical protein
VIDVLVKCFLNSRHTLEHQKKNDGLSSSRRLLNLYTPEKDDAPYIKQIMSLVSTVILEIKRKLQITCLLIKTCFLTGLTK